MAQEIANKYCSKKPIVYYFMIYSLKSNFVELLQHDLFFVNLFHSSFKGQKIMITQLTLELHFIYKLHRNKQLNQVFLITVTKFYEFANVKLIIPISSVQQCKIATKCYVVFFSNSWPSICMMQRQEIFLRSHNQVPYKKVPSSSRLIACKNVARFPKPYTHDIRRYIKVHIGSKVVKLLQLGCQHF